MIGRSPRSRIDIDDEEATVVLVSQDIEFTVIQTHLCTKHQYPLRFGGRQYSFGACQLDPEVGVTESLRYRPILEVNEGYPSAQDRDPDVLNQAAGYLVVDQTLVYIAGLEVGNRAGQDAAVVLSIQIRFPNAGADMCSGVDCQVIAEHVAKNTVHMSLADISTPQVQHSVLSAERGQHRIFGGERGVLPTNGDYERRTWLIRNPIPKNKAQLVDNMPVCRQLRPEQHGSTAEEASSRVCEVGNAGR
jgi:hypothetical protein